MESKKIKQNKPGSGDEPKPGFYSQTYKSVRKFVRKFCKLLIYSVYCGERGIRTPGGVTLNGFQDRRNRPLCHLSFGFYFHCYAPAL